MNKITVDDFDFVDVENSHSILMNLGFKICVTCNIEQKYYVYEYKNDYDDFIHLSIIGNFFSMGNEYGGILNDYDLLNIIYELFKHKIIVKRSDKNDK